MKKQESSKKAINFKSVADDFRQLNQNDPGLWPTIPRVSVLALLFIIAIAVIWFVVWSGQLDDLERRQQEEIQLKEKWVTEKGKAVNLDAYRKQLAEIDRQFGALLRQLPNRSEMEALLIDVNQAGRGRGLQFELWKPGVEVPMEGFYAELPIALRVTGSYDDFGNFASDVAKLPRIVTLRDLSIEVVKDGALKMDANAVTYRYLDEDEINAQKRDAKGKKR